MRAGSRSLLSVATFLAATAWASLAWADTPDPLLVDLFFDVAGDDLAEADAAAGEDAAGPSEILIGGIPLRIGEGAADGGWRTMAGANGRYTRPLGGGFTMIARTRVTQTDFVAPGVADRSVGSAATEFRYAVDGWTFGLQPGVEATRWDSEVLQHESGIEGRVAKALGGGVSLATSGRYRWRTMIGGGAADREIAAGRAGLVYNLPHRLRLDVAYVVRQEVEEAGSSHPLPSVIESDGPSLALALPAGETLDLTANYDFTTTTRDQPAAGLPGCEDLHQLSFGATWNLGGEAADIELSASYKYGHLDAPGSDAPAARHAGTVSFGLDF